MSPLKTALFLYEQTNDPLTLDAVRALSTPSTPAPVLASVVAYVEAQREAYLTLYGNSDKPLPHGNDT